MIDLTQNEIWFVTGSQHLYGPKTLEQVAANSREIAAALGASAEMPVNVVFKPVVTTPEAIREVCLEANSAKNCIGLIFWMHTFSPAKMWIAGLQANCKKPFAQLHTQFNRRNPLG
jgi:L-arabinose isomerase